MWFFRAAGVSEGWSLAILVALPIVLSIVAIFALWYEPIEYVDMDEWHGSDL